MCATDRVRRYRACSILLSVWTMENIEIFRLFPDSKTTHISGQSHKKERTMKTAIIGLGNIGLRLAANLTRGGEHIIVSERDLDKARQRAASLGTTAEALTIDEAVSKADVIVLAIMFDAIKEFIASHHAALAGKIVVDPSNPIAPDGKGGFTKTLPADKSSGQVIARLLPEG